MRNFSLTLSGSNPLNAHKVALRVVEDFEKRIANGEAIAKIDSTLATPDAPLRTSEGGLSPSEVFTFDITDLDPATAVYKLTLV